MDPQDQKTSINIPGYGPLPFVDTNPRNFFRRTTILYGPSETGKSFIGKWIMNILKPYIANVIIICPTEGSNEGYKGIVPERCIKTKIDVKELKDIYDRQASAVEIYNKANNMDVLKSLFDKANDMGAQQLVSRIERISKAKLDEIKRSFILNFAQKKEQKESAEKKMLSVIIQLYKKTIKNYRDSLLTRSCLSEDERYALKYLDFNPSLLLILDDCQAEIAKWANDETICKLFFQGRHLWVSSMYMLQSDSGRPGLAPGIRKNTFNSIFTDPNVAMHFFKNEENSFTPKMKKDAMRIAEEIFKPNPDGSENFKRFVYSRMDKVAKFRYVVADAPDDLKIGCPALWKLCGSVPSEKKTETQQSKFTKCFTTY
jgi:hypothetical protein